MPINLLKKYPELLELNHLSEFDRNQSLRAIFKRDIEDNEKFEFRKKIIRPIKKEGQAPMATLFHHLTTRQDRDEKGRKLRKRTFEMARSQRLHWIKFRIDEKKPEKVEVFSYEDRDQKQRKDVVRTYIYDKAEQYVVILEPQRSGTDYYLLTAYYLNEPGGKKQIEKKLKKKLLEVH